MRRRRSLIQKKLSDLDVTRSSTRAGLVAIVISGSIILLILSIYLIERRPELQLPQPLELPQQPPHHQTNMAAQIIDYAQLLANTEHHENNVYKSANILATNVADNIFKLITAVVVEEHRVQVMDVSRTFFAETYFSK
jgi:hypothetical protein